MAAANPEDIVWLDLTDFERLERPLEDDKDSGPDAFRRNVADIAAIS